MIGVTEKFLFTAVILTGGPPRPEKTARALKALNDQSFNGIQKIFINNARTKEEIDLLRAKGNLTEDWEVITFEISEYISGDYGSVWRVPGSRALDEAIGRYIFFQSDDDFLADDFFSKMASLFENHSDAVCAVGLPVFYNWLTNEKFLKPGRRMWTYRPTLESGRDLLFKQLADATYSNNCLFSYVMETSKVRDVRDSLFETGFPDHNCLLQVGIRGSVAFDRSAEMYWGVHPDQDNRSWRRENVLHASFGNFYDECMKINFPAMEKFLPNSQKERFAIRKSFNTFLSHRSSQIVFDRLLQKMGLIPVPRDLIGEKINVKGHLALMCRVPSQSLFTILQCAKRAIRGGFRKLSQRS
jgi:hypothetical protein